ncbi:MAG: hypothetical protein M0015_07700 [Betaproteobacteria bacterium]|nr:hypothetical protein [Betaproteobacteria bacterium]
MAKGKPSKWAKLDIDESVWLGKKGISIKVWDKWGKKHKGTLVISIGGLRWYKFNAKKPTWRAAWDSLVNS